MVSDYFEELQKKAVEQEKESIAIQLLRLVS